jgi:hypothetical protein
VFLWSPCIYIYIYILHGFNVWRLLLTYTFHCLRQFHSPILRPPSLTLCISHLPLTAVYIPSFQVLRGRPSYFLPSGFQVIIIFGNRIGYLCHIYTALKCFRVLLPCSFPVISTEKFPSSTIIFPGSKKTLCSTNTVSAYTRRTTSFTKAPSDF